MTTKEAILQSIKNWVRQYETYKEVDKKWLEDLSQSAYELLLEIKDSLEIGELN